VVFNKKTGHDLAKMDQRATISKIVHC
jgi:hypothetical protein